MFNGIIYKTGKVKKILKNKDSIYVGIQSKTNLNMKDIGSSLYKSINLDTSLFNSPLVQFRFLCTGF